MLIPTITTIRTEDFPNQRDWISNLLFPINQVFTSVIAAINGNITFGDNIPCQTQIVSFTYSGASDFPKTFKWNLSSKPIELRICSATENSVAIGAILSWSYSNNQVSITGISKVSSGAISALTVGNIYTFVLRGQP